MTPASPGPSRLVDVTRDVGRQEWQELADRSPAATFFHTPAWFEAFCATLPGARVRIEKYVFEDGKTAILPLLELSRHGLSRRYLSGPAGCYGGWISADTLDAAEAAAVTTSALGRFKNLIWRINPFEAQRDVLAPLVTQDDSTEVLHLDRFGDAATVLGGYEKDVRRLVRKGARAGLQVREARGWEEWVAYYDVYLRALRRWGPAASSRYPLTLFRTLHDLHNPGVKLWVVTTADGVGGGSLHCYQGRHCVEWHAASDERFRQLGARNFLVHQIVTDALERGFAVYDCNPSGGHEGVRRFKRTFGTTSLPCGVIDTRGPLARSLAGARRWASSRLGV